MGRKKREPRGAGFLAKLGGRKQDAAGTGTEAELPGASRAGEHGAGPATSVWDGPPAIPETASYQYYSSLIDNSFDLIFVVDVHGKILFMGPSVERTLGYKPHELVGKSSFDFLHPEDLPTVVGFFSRGASRSGFSGNVICRVRRRGGEWRHVERWATTSSTIQSCTAS